MYLETTSSLIELLNLYSSSCIKTSKLCCCIKFGDFSTFLLRLKFLILSSKFILWVYIFNLTFFFLKILLKIVVVLMCFTNLHFTKNNWYYLRRFVAYRSFFCPWMFMFILSNSSKCYKLLILFICTQIIVDGSAILHFFM